MIVYNQVSEEIQVKRLVRRIQENSEMIFSNLLQLENCDSGHPGPGPGTFTLLSLIITATSANAEYFTNLINPYF